MELLTTFEKYEKKTLKKRIYNLHKLTVFNNFLVNIFTCIAVEIIIPTTT